VCCWASDTCSLIARSSCFLGLLHQAKYLVAILILIALATSLGGSNGVAISPIWRRALWLPVFENSYRDEDLASPHRKRSTACGMRTTVETPPATKKFKVYMNRHQDDPKRFVDESELRKMEEWDKKNRDGDPGGWCELAAGY